jgi:hypothetical protein
MRPKTQTPRTARERARYIAAEHRRITQSRRYRACRRSPALALAHQLVDRADELADAIDRFLSDHQFGCRCPLCSYASADNGVQTDLVTLSNVLRFAASSVGGVLIPLPRPAAAAPGAADATAEKGGRS